MLGPCKMNRETSGYRGTFTIGSKTNQAELAAPLVIMNHPFDYPANLTQESTNSMLERFFAAILLPILVGALSAPSLVRGKPLPDIRIDNDGKTFVTAEGTSFRPWGVNYDHNESTGGLIEDYWAEDWEVIE